METERPSDVSAGDALRRLKEGNARFLRGESIQPKSQDERRLGLMATQAPFAVVLTCSDSRVVPGLVFDQGIGDLFVVRVAGNILDDAVLGTIEYAIGELGVQLVVVMGHQGCGAVKAAMLDSKGTTHLDELVHAIRPAVKRANGRLEDAIRFNAANVAAELRAHGIVLGPAIAAGKLAIEPAYYGFETGEVDFIDIASVESGLETVPPMSGAPHPLLQKALAFLDVAASSNEGFVLEALRRLHDEDALSNEDERRIRRRLEASGAFADVEDLGHGVGVLRVPTPELETGQVVLLSCTRTSLVPGAQTLPHRFLWIVFGPDNAAAPGSENLEPFGWMLLDERFIGSALPALSRGEIVETYQTYLAFVESPASGEQVPPELRRSGRFGGGLIEDFKRRLPLYASDFKDGLNSKTIASVLFLFFACFAPAVAFGGLLSVLTENSIGVVEMIVGTFVCGTVYALAAGQPLTILGSTGPVIVFVGIVYQLCHSLGAPFLPTLTCIGLWTSVILIVLALADAASLIRYFTRFTDEIFSALIAIIFIVEALKDVLEGFTTPGVPHDTALLSLVLALGTFVVANGLNRFGSSVYLLRPIREFIADFGPAIAILSMTCLAIWLHPVKLAALDVPARFAPTMERTWFVSPLDAPPWVWVASFVPALLVSVLLFLDQNITVRLVNDKRHAFQKGVGYHLDLLVVGLLVGVCSLFGLPWMVAATVRSLNHVRALAKTQGHGSNERIVAVHEQRLSGLLVHLLIGASLLFLSLLATIPMSVLFGLFLYMGIASLRGNQFFERLRLWVMDPKFYPPTHFLRRVPTGVVHMFTAVQAALLVLLWVVKTSTLGILFPLFIGLLVPVRFFLERFFDAKHLAFLDAEEAPAEGAGRPLD